MIDFKISIYTKINNVLQSASYCMIFIVLLPYRYCIVLFTVYLALAVFFIINITNTCFSVFTADSKSFAEKFTCLCK